MPFGVCILFKMTRHWPNSNVCINYVYTFSSKFLDLFIHFYLFLLWWRRRCIHDKHMDTCIWCAARKLSCHIFTSLYAIYTVIYKWNTASDTTWYRMLGFLCNVYIALITFSVAKCSTLIGWYEMMLTDNLIKSYTTKNGMKHITWFIICAKSWCMVTCQFCLI